MDKIAAEFPGLFALAAWLEQTRVGSAIAEGRYAFPIIEGIHLIGLAAAVGLLMLVDLRPKKLTGKAAEVALGRAEITCNKSGVPFDPEKPWVTSGIRLGAPAATSRGFGAAEFKKVGELIVETLDGVAKNGDAGNAAVEASVRGKVEELTKRFPIY